MSHSSSPAASPFSTPRSVAVTLVLLLLATPVRLATQEPDRSTDSSTLALSTTDGTIAPSPLLEPARLTVEDVPLADALTLLRQSSGVRLAFSPSMLPEKRVSCSCARVTVGEALDKLLAGAAFQYFPVAGQVLIEPASGGHHAEVLSSLVGFRPAVDTRVVRSGGDFTRPITRQGTITGSVTAARTLQPLAGAQASIPGAGIEAQTGDEGRYRLTGVPAGETTVRVQMIGYATGTRTVSVADGETTVVDFELNRRAIALDELVVTATGEQRRRELGSAIAQVNAEEVTRTAPVASISELLTGRVAGVTINSTTGTTAEPSRIRVRGSSSTSLSNEPLIYVDGVRVDSDPARRGDINPEYIESMEIVKGPSASTLYGTEAANGVILITTKSGADASGPNNRWNVWTEAKLTTEPNDYPAIYGAVDQAGDPCPLTAVVAGQCAQSELRTFNLLENPRTTPFQNGLGGQLGTSLRGSVENIDYFASGEFEKDRGVYTNDEIDQAHLRANIGLRPAEDIRVQLNTGYVTQDQRLFIEGGTTFGPVTNGLLGAPNEDGWFQYSPEKLDRIDTRQEVERILGSATLRATPTSWLELRLVSGLDVSTRMYEQLFPVGEFSGDEERGLRDTERVQTRNYTVEVLATAETSPLDVLSSRSSVGAQYFADVTNGVSAEGRQLAPGTNSLAGAAVSQAVENNVESRALGLFADQRFGYDDRLFVTGGLRADDNSTFGRAYDVVVYPKVSASWVLLEGDSGGPEGGLVGATLNSFRLRAAWGESGNQPGFTDALRFYNSISATAPDGESQIGVTFDGGGIGNPSLKPERSSEIEVGFDAGLLDDRVDLAATYYVKSTEDALIFREVGPSVGATEGRWENLAKTENEGVEVLLEALVLDQEDVQFSLPISASYNDNTLIELGRGISPLTAGNFQRHVEGFPLGGYWGQAVRGFEDANGDGIVAPDEITVTDTAVYRGEVFPPFSVSSQPSLRLFERLELAGILDYRGGYQHYNYTEAFRCLLGASRYRHDPTSPLDDQANCVAYAVLGANGTFTQDSDFLKLRELSASWTIPESWSQRFGAEAATVTVAGRNLATWTSYPGIDPELARAGESNFETNDYFQPGPVRRWTFRANISF